MAGDEGKQVITETAQASTNAGSPAVKVVALPNDDEQKEQDGGAQPATNEHRLPPTWLQKPDAKVEPYRDAIQQACKVLRLPFWLVCAQIAQESDFDTQAKSSCGAIGLMQIMPATARSCGIDPEKLWAPDANIRLGCRILADRRDVFQKEDPEERLKFALAAYNGGLGPVINAQALAFRHGFDPSHWQNVRLMLPETWVYLDGEWKKPDYKQIIEYVDRIWQRYEVWKE